MRWPASQVLPGEGSLAARSVRALSLPTAPLSVERPGRSRPCCGWSRAAHDSQPLAGRARPWYVQVRLRVVRASGAPPRTDPGIGSGLRGSSTERGSRGHAGEWLLVTPGDRWSWLTETAGYRRPVRYVSQPRDRGRSTGKNVTFVLLPRLIYRTCRGWESRQAGLPHPARAGGASRFVSHLAPTDRVGARDQLFGRTFAR